MRAAWIAVLLLSPISWGADPESFVVKINSYMLRPKIQFEGSGMLVRYQKSIYVLTSEHVVFHDNDPGTHLEFYLGGKASRTPQSMTYINSEWGTGLAILKASDQFTAEHVSDDLPLLDDLAKVSSPKVNEQAISVGYPVRSDSMIVDVDGSVSSTTNISMVLADIEKLLEIKGAHGEFGMSGGVVLNRDAVPIGILSHETPDEQNKILFAIPISQAAQWAIHFITDPNAKPRLVRATSELVDTNQYRQRVRNGRLIIDWMPTFDEKHPAYVYMGWDNTLWKNGLNPPTDPYPTDLFDRTTRRISAFLDGDGFDNGYYANSEVAKFRPRNLLKFKEMKGLSSFVEFFRNLKDPTLKPMAVFDRQGAQPWDWYSYDYCKASKEIDFATYQNLGERLWPALKAIADLAGCISTDQWGTELKTKYPVAALNREDIETVLNGPEYQADWNAWQIRSKADYEGVRDALKTIEKVLVQLTI